MYSQSVSQSVSQIFPLQKKCSRSNVGPMRLAIAKSTTNQLQDLHVITAKKNNNN